MSKKEREAFISIEYILSHSFEAEAGLLETMATAAAADEDEEDADDEGGLDDVDGDEFALLSLVEC